MASKKFDLSVILSLVDKASGPLKKFGGKAKAAGKAMSVGLTAPLVGFGVLAVKTATDFQTSMNMVGAVTKTTGTKAFAELNAKAKELGATTQFSASQAAEAMKFMGMSGMKANDIIAASPKVLQLAAAAQLDMASAADTVTNIMAGFGIEAKDLTRVNDALVNAFTGSNVNLQQLGEAMKMAGPVAKLNMSLEETVATLGLLGTAGFQGGMAGTALKRVLMNLASPTKKQAHFMAKLGGGFLDAEGKVKPMVEVLKIFEKAAKDGATEAQINRAAMEIMGDRGYAPFMALLGQGSDKLAKFTKEVKTQGTAAAVSEAQMRGLPGAVKLLASSWEAVQLAVVDSGLGKIIEDLMRSVANFFMEVAKTNPEMLAWGVAIAGVVAALGPLLIVIGSLATILPIIGAGFATLMGPVGLVILAIAALAAGAVLIYKNWEPIKKFFIDLWQEGVIEPIELAKQRFGEIADAFGNVFAAPIQAIKQSFTEITAWIDSKLKVVTDALPDWAKKALGIGGTLNAKSQNTIDLNISAPPGYNLTTGKVTGPGDTKVKTYTGANLATAGWGR